MSSVGLCHEVAASDPIVRKLDTCEHTCGVVRIQINLRTNELLNLARVFVLATSLHALGASAGVHQGRLGVPYNVPEPQMQL